MNGGGETVRGVVAEFDGVLLVLEFRDAADGAEDLFFDDPHVGSDVGEDGGLDEIPFFAVAFAAGDDLGAGVLAVLDVAHDPVILQLGDLGALERVGVERVADDVLAGAGLEGFDEFVVDVFLHEDAGTGTAALAVVVEDAEVDPRDGVFDVGVVEDDVGGFATEFERHFLQVGFCRGLHDGAADYGGSGEGDLVDVHVRCDGLKEMLVQQFPQLPGYGSGLTGTGSLAEPRDDVDNTGWETSFLDESCGVESRQWSLLGGLEDDGITGSHGRANLPRQHHYWEIPGDDLTTDTDRLMSGIVERFRVGVNDLSVELVGPTTVVPDCT